VTLFAYVLGAVFTASLLVTVWLCVGDAVRAAWRIRRAAHADDAFAQAHCGHCERLDSDAANGITPTDFTLWEIEWSTP
jgi:hypothetical protein